MRQMEPQPPSTKEEKRELRVRFAQHLMPFLAEDYKAGEIDLQQALRVIDGVALDVGPENRAKVLGEMTGKALDAGTPRYLGRRTRRIP